MKMSQMLVNKTTLQANFHLPLKEAANNLGLCPTSLKRKCRRAGIERWPYRKLKSINSQIEDVKRLMETGNQRIRHQERLANLEARKEALLNPPADASRMQEFIEQKATDILSQVSNQIIWHTSEVDEHGTMHERSSALEYCPARHSQDTPSPIPSMALSYSSDGWSSPERTRAPEHRNTQPILAPISPTSTPSPTPALPSLSIPLTRASPLPSLRAIFGDRVHTRLPPLQRDRHDPNSPWEV